MANKFFKTPVHDTRLTWQATGLLAFMSAYDPGTIFTLDSLASAKLSNAKATRKILQTLIELGYIDRQENREKGRFSGVAYRLKSS